MAFVFWSCLSKHSRGLGTTNPLAWLDLQASLANNGSEEIPMLIFDLTFVLMFVITCLCSLGNIELPPRACLGQSQL